MRSQRCTSGRSIHQQLVSPCRLPACQGVALLHSISHSLSHRQPHLSSAPLQARVEGRSLLTAIAGAVGATEDEDEGVLSASELDFGFSSAQGVRDTMEDEVHVHYDEKGQYLYAAVFDGHGGDAAAQWLGKQLHLQVDKCMAGLCETTEPCTVSPQRPQSVTTSLVDSFHAADKQLLSYLADAGGDGTAQAGSTATIAVVKNGRIVVANVGDSTAVLSRKGAPVILARQHRVYGTGADVQGEIERVKSTGGWVDDGRVCGVLAVSRAFGDCEFKGAGLDSLLSAGIQKGYWDAAFASNKKFVSDPVVATPDVTETVVTADDEFLMVASDGVWDVLPPAEAVRWARKEFKGKATAQEVAASLAALAIKRYTTDNVAVVVIDLQGADFWQAKPKKDRKPFMGGMFNKK